MFSRFEMKVSYNGKNIFTGCFMSINRAIKTACCFDEKCVFYMYDYLTDKTYTTTLVWNLIKEFKNGEIYL